MYKRKALLIVQITFYIAVIWFVIKRFSDLASSVDVSAILHEPLYLLLAVVCFVGFYALFSLHWKRLCDKYTKYPQQRQWLAFFASQPFKYLPSSVFAFSSRAVYAKKLGLPIKQSTLVQLMENINILLSGFIIALVFLAYNTSTSLGLGASLVLLLGLGVTLFIPEIKVPKSALTISGREWVGLFSMALGAWVLTGIGFYAMVQATGQHISFATAVAANAIAVGLGIVAIFAPGGIGVREYVYSKFGIESGGFIMWRLMTLVIDVIIGITAIYIINRITSKKPVQSD